MKHTLIDAQPKLDRRATLRWLAAAMASGPLAACGESPTTPPGEFSWIEPAALTGPGYGGDPNLLEPTIPWPLTLSQSELSVLEVLVDIILPQDGDAPAASTIGAHEFLNEWVSAPYPRQQGDRALVVPGIGWLNSESSKRFGKDFAFAQAAERLEIVDEIAWRERVKPENEKPAQFFARVRSLTMGAYFTSASGWRDLGYLGNTPATGDYAGPTQEALDHLRSVLAGMGLELNPEFETL